jgi:hypothetical protein
MDEDYPLKDLLDRIVSGRGFYDSGGHPAISVNSLEFEFNRYSREHPGLVDLTLCGRQCPAYFDDWMDIEPGTNPECRAFFCATTEEEPCSVLSRRALAKRGRIEG